MPMPQVQYMALFSTHYTVFQHLLRDYISPKIDCNTISVFSFNSLYKAKGSRRGVILTFQYGFL